MFPLEQLSLHLEEASLVPETAVGTN